MKRLKRAALWCLLLNKRCLKKPAFPVLLALTLLLPAVLSAAASGAGGILTVALCASDAYSEALSDQLAGESGAIRFVRCLDAGEARAMVSGGEADAAWIFSPQTKREIERYVSGHSARAVTVVEREDNVFLMLSREKLYASLYPAVSFEAFSALLERESGESVPEALRWEYYHRRTADRPLVTLTDLSGAETGEAPILASPLRGLLAILVMLGGLSAGVVLLDDRARGVLAWASPSGSVWLSAAYLLPPMLDLALAAVLSLRLAGLSAGLAGELGPALLLTLAGGGMCALAALACRRPERLSALALLLTVCMLALCPVFLSVRALRPASILLPPYWYLCGDAPALLVYAAVSWLLYFLLFRLCSGTKKTRPRRA